MSGSSNLNSFRDRGQVGRTVGVLWGVAARTCSGLHAAFLCNCHLASFPAVTDRDIEGNDRSIDRQTEV